LLDENLLYVAGIESVLKDNHLKAEETTNAGARVTLLKKVG
jgi:hypothetical protein